MILDPDTLVAGYPFLAQRHRRVALCDPFAVQDCCARAAELAGSDPATEPAAMFFMFAGRRRAFPFAWKLMADFVARAQAQANGRVLEASRADLEALCVAVLYRRSDWNAVRGWFAPRVLPLLT